MAEMTAQPVVEWNLWQTIIDRSITRDDVAVEYADVLAFRHLVDWPGINRAIIARWSKSGLEYIKRAAWKLRAAESHKEEEG